MTSKWTQREWRGVSFKIMDEGDRFRAVIYNEFQQPISTTTPTPNRNRCRADARTAIDAIIAHRQDEAQTAKIQEIILDVFENNRETIRELLGIPAEVEA